MKGIKIHTDPILGCGKICVSGERFFKFLYVDVNLDCGAISRILEIINYNLPDFLFLYVVQ